MTLRLREIRWVRESDVGLDERVLIAAEVIHDDGRAGNVFRFYGYAGHWHYVASESLVDMVEMVNALDDLLWVAREKRDGRWPEARA